MFNQSSEQKYTEPESANLIFLSNDIDNDLYVPMKEICSKAKDIDSLEYAFARKTCSLALRLKNGTFRFVNSSEELNIALSKVFDICFPIFTRLSPLKFSQLKII